MALTSPSHKLLYYSVCIVFWQWFTPDQANTIFLKDCTNTNISANKNDLYNLYNLFLNNHKLIWTSLNYKKLMTVNWIWEGDFQQIWLRFDSYLIPLGLLDFEFIELIWLPASNQKYSISYKIKH